MGKYSIKELECLSGIKAHTLRIWEKRFNLLNPERTDTNIRYYSDEDLKKILNVSLLTFNGLKISEIAGFSDKQLAEAVVRINNEEIRNLKRVNELIISMNELDEEHFHSLFDKYVSSLGFEKTIEEVVYPYLEKVGILWLSGEVQAIQEHMISNLIRGKIIRAIDELEYPANAKKSIILFLPEGEFHELGLLYFNYILRKKGVKVIYLGQSTPVKQVEKLSAKLNTDFMLTYSIVKSRREVEDMLKVLNKNPNSKTIFIENKQQALYKIDYPSNVMVFNTIKEAALEVVRP